MSTTNPLMDRALPAALQMLGRARVAGILTVTGTAGTATFQLQDGNVLWASSNTVPRLGETLVKRGFITQDVLDNALRLQKRKRVSQPLIKVLHEWDLLSREVAEAEIIGQLTRVIANVLGWDDGTLRIERIEPVDDLVTTGCDVETALLRAAMVQAGLEESLVATHGGSFAG